MVEYQQRDPQVFNSRAFGDNTHSITHTIAVLIHETVRTATKPATDSRMEGMGIVDIS